MNHGLKINNNVLEITLPEEVHINRVMVNRQIFSQRMSVCKSCKYHEKEGHEEPCVSCEVGNSNYAPSVGLEERTEERTETHACDSISRQAAIDIVEFECGEWMGLARTIIKAIEQLPSAQPERKKGKWIWQIENRYVCSECGYHTQVDELFEEPMYAFCPYCSTSMLDEDGDVRYER